MNFMDIIKQPAMPIRAMAGEDVYNNPRANDAWMNVSHGHGFDAETFNGLRRASHQDITGGSTHAAEQWDNEEARNSGGLRMDQEQQLSAHPGQSLDDIKYQQMLADWFANKKMIGTYGS